MKKYGWLLFLICFAAACTTSSVAQHPVVADPKIHHDPEIDFKQRRGLNHNRNYLKEKLAAYNLNTDSLQDVVDGLNRETPGKEWEYQVSTAPSSPGQIRKVYKSHRNPDGSSGRTNYGDEIRRRPDTR